MSTKEEAGRRIQAARLAKDMTLEEVSARAPGISVSRLSNWEQGRNMIGVDEAKKLAPVLGVSAAYILTLEDMPNDLELKKLNELYLVSDERGKAAILRAAESESVYSRPNRRIPTPETGLEALEHGRRHDDRKDQ